MIRLYRPEKCPSCADIEAKLKELVIAYQLITVGSEEQPDGLPADTPLPAITDDGKIFTGQPDISHYLGDLERFVTDWRRFQSDACYLDDDGETC